MAVTYSNRIHECTYQPPSEARGLRYLKNTFVTRMIMWAQNVKSAPVGGSAPRRLSVRLSVCPSVCPLLTVLVWNRWTIQAEIFRGPSGQVQARIFLKSARSVEIRPSYGQKTAKKRLKKRDERVLTGGKNFVPNFLYLLCVSCNSKQLSKNLQKKISEKYFGKNFLRKKIFSRKKNFLQIFWKMLRIAWNAK